MIDEELEKAYKNALYRIFNPDISWQIGELSPALDRLLQEHHTQSASFITAYNPQSIILSTAENQKRQSKLLAEIKAQDWQYLEGQGEDPSGNWPAEASFLVFGHSRTAAQELGRQFGQNAVVFLTLGEAACLLPCFD